MAFGNSVTDFSQISIGTVGYTIRIDTTGLRAFRVRFVQAQASASDTPSPVTSEVALETIQEYLNSNVAPDLAFNFGYGEVTVFFKISVFPYTTNTRIALFGERNPVAMVQPDDKADFADQDLELFTNYVLKHAYILQKIPVPGNIERRIRELENDIKANN